MYALKREALACVAIFPFIHQNNFALSSLIALESSPKPATHTRMENFPKLLRSICFDLFSMLSMDDEANRCWNYAPKTLMLGSSTNTHTRRRQSRIFSGKTTRKSSLLLSPRLPRPKVFSFLVYWTAAVCLLPCCWDFWPWTRNIHFMWQFVFGGRKLQK